MIYTLDEFPQFRNVGHLAALCLDMIESRIHSAYDNLEFIKDGWVTTQDIDDWVKQFADEHDLICAPLNYNNFPAHCCTSVNHVCCHGIPSKNKTLHVGDIVKVDVTFINKNGYYGDTCRTIGIGHVSGLNSLVTDAAQDALMHGINAIGPGKHIGDIGNAIRVYVDELRTGQPKCSIVRDFVGHGIGKQFHEWPDVPHYCSPSRIKDTAKLEPGLVFTVEPIINIGKPDVKILSDGWTVVTKDKRPSAQFEHTVGIKEDGFFEIFTQ